MLTSIGDVMREAYKRGWITTRDGNISFRKNDEIFITPSGVKKYTIYPENLISGYVDHNFELINDHLTKPSGELEMHRLLQTLDFNSYNESRAVVHLHPTNIIAAIYKGFDLQILAQEFPEVSRYTKVGPTVPILPATSEELADATFQAMSDASGEKLIYNIVGQANHGVCAIGKSPWDAFEHIERLEHICQIVLASGV